MLYFIQIVLEVCATIIAYITNPIVCLFADEYGNLPKCLKYWQTHDNCLDIEWMISEDIVPKFAQYDFNKHYVYHLEYKDEGVMVPGYVDIIDGNFTLYEKFQRYICRLCWMYRNCNYGFSYFINGRDIDVMNLVVLKDYKDSTKEIFVGYDKTGNILTRTWCVFISVPYCKYFKLRVYLGWKLKSKTSGRHMLALFIWPFRLNK